jgi:hypothetical protein
MRSKEDPVKIKLKSNGYVMEATVSANGTYEYRKTNGQVKFYSDDQVILLNEEVLPEITESDDNKEKKMEIFHYLQQLNGKEGSMYTVRIVTTDLGDVADRYNESVTTRHPSHNILAISTGAYTFSLMEWELIRKGKEFKLMIIGNKDLAANYSKATVRGMIERSTFAYANASYSFFLRVVGSEWGLQDFKMELDYAKKSAKRAQELFRLTDMAWHTYGPEKMDMVILESGDLNDEPDEFYDGMSYIRQSVAVKMALGCKNINRRRKMIREIRTGKMVRIGFRYNTSGGMVKGDAIIVPDSQISRDVVTHDTNMKGELTTDNGTHMAGWNHSTRHLAVWDDQSTINFGAALTEEKQIADIHRILQLIVESLNRGELPEWLLLGERDRDEHGVPDMEKLSDSMNKQWIKAQAHGFDIRSFQNLVYMGLGGLPNRMRSDTVRSKFLGVDVFKKMWIPMSNAMLGAIVTWESCVNMGGFTFPGRDKDKMFFDPRVGLVISGKRFKETFDLHGTWDLDDAVKAVHIKLWASGDISVHLGKTLDENIVLPTKAEDAIDMVLLVRSPNGPGEYSIEVADMDGMFIEEMVNAATVVTVDMCTMPLPQDLLLEEVEVSGLPTSTIYSNDLVTRDDAFEMISAQAINPGVGQVCNALMAWAEVNGPSFPPVMVDVLGNIVDAAQMGTDGLSFQAISAEPDSIMDQLVLAVEAGAKIDASIAATRVPFKYHNVLRSNMVIGRATRVQRVYREVINTIVTELQLKSLQWRQASDFVGALKGITFGAQQAAWSANFYYKFNSALAAIDTEFKVDPKADPFTRMHLQYQQKIAMEAVVAEMVTEITASGDDDVVDRHILGLYKWIVSPMHGKNFPMGIFDRIIVQSGGEGNLSLLDILIEAATRFGLV